MLNEVETLAALQTVLTQFSKELAELTEKIDFKEIKRPIAASYLIQAEELRTAALNLDRKIEWSKTDA